MSYAVTTVLDFCSTAEIIVCQFKFESNGSSAPQLKKLAHKLTKFRMKYFLHLSHDLRGRGLKNKCKQNTPTQQAGITVAYLG